MNYYSDKITEGGHNTKTLFKIAKELTCHNENPILPSHNDPNILANEISGYFCDEAKKISDNITIDLSKGPPSETSATKSCELAPIPTWLVSVC